MQEFVARSKRRARVMKENAWISMNWRTDARRKHDKARICLNMQELSCTWFLPIYIFYKKQEIMLWIQDFLLRWDSCFSDHDSCLVWTIHFLSKSKDIFTSESEKVPKWWFRDIFSIKYWFCTCFRHFPTF